MSKRFEKAKEYTQKYKDLLPPCKYCGSTDIRITSDRTILGKKSITWSVVCATPGCDCTKEYTSVKQAIKAWIDKGVMV